MLMYCARARVCVDYEEALTAIMEALAQIVQHINILYSLLQSLMDE